MTNPDKTKHVRVLETGQTGRQRVGTEPPYRCGANTVTVIRADAKELSVSKPGTRAVFSDLDDRAHLAKRTGDRSDPPPHQPHRSGYARSAETKTLVDAAIKVACST